MRIQREFTRGRSHTSRRAGYVLYAMILCVLCAVVRGEQEAGSQADFPVADAAAKLGTLLAKAESINDVTAKIIITRRDGKVSPPFQYYWSRTTGLTRIDHVVQDNVTMKFFIDPNAGRVFIQLGEDQVSLDGGISRGFILLAEKLAPKTDINAYARSQIYYAGTETVDGRAAELFVLVRGNVIRKLWIGIEDGFAYREELLDSVTDLLDVRFNTGLDKEFLGATFPAEGMPAIRPSELPEALLRAIPGKTNGN